MKPQILAAAVTAAAAVAAGAAALIPVVAYAAPAPAPTFAMTTSTATEPLQAARFQITTATTGVVGKVTVALPASMIEGAVMRSVSTLPAGKTTLVPGGIAYTVSKPIQITAGFRVWLTVSGVATPPPGMVAPWIQVWSATGVRLATGTAPALTFAAGPACRSGGWPADYIATENALPGTSAWKIASPGQIVAYSELASARCGDSVFIRSDGPLNGVVRLVVYRMGYYGGYGARAVWSTPAGPWLLGDDQPAPLFIATDSQGRTVNEVKATNWRRTFGFKVDGRFTPGTYLIALTDSAGVGSYVPLTVRDDVGDHKYVMLSSTNTWQAYNTYGGHSAYGEGPSRRLSYDRPYAQNAGSGDFLGFEYGYVFWAEKQGLDMDYITDMQVHYNPETIDGSTLVIPGHPEYWSPNMRATLTGKIAAGTNLLSMSANSIYWQIKPTSTREFEAFKGTYGLQTTFRTPPPAGPGQPEQSIFGAMYFGCYQVDGTTVADDESWLWTAVTPGTQIPHLPAAEVDRQVADQPIPAGTTVLDTTPLTKCSGRTATPEEVMQVTAVDAGGGAGRIFHGASIGWACALSDQCVAYGSPYSVTTAGALAVGQATLNAMAWLDTGVTAPTTLAERTQRQKVGELRLKGGLPAWVRWPQQH